MVIFIYFLHQNTAKNKALKKQKVYTNKTLFFKAQKL